MTELGVHARLRADATELVTSSRRHSRSGQNPGRLSALASMPDKYVSHNLQQAEILSYSRLTAQTGLAFAAKRFREQVATCLRHVCPRFPRLNCRPVLRTGSRQ